MPKTMTTGVTLEEFLQMDDPADGSQLELYNGEVIVVPSPKGRHGVVCTRIASKLFNFVDARKLGWVTSNDVGVPIIGERESMRGVDVGYWNIADNPVIPIAYFDNPPDLAVEVMSPNFNRKDTHNKLKQYVEAGVKLVWFVDPEREVVTVYRGNMRGIEHSGDDELMGENVLPGFVCKVRDFF